jgi:hypothetical protein
LRILENVHRCAKRLHNAGHMDDLAMHEFDALCLPPCPDSMGDGDGKPEFIRRTTLHVTTGGTKKWRALYMCRCGTEFETQEIRVKSGHTNSCGCQRKITATEATRKANTTHGHMIGHKATRSYSTWSSMVQRCTNTNHTHYRLYGGRGIVICDRWRSSFADFLSDMGERPDGTSLDRWPNKDGNYEPGNCRWATPKEQAGNRHSRWETAPATTIIQEGEECL